MVQLRIIRRMTAVLSPRHCQPDGRSGWNVRSPTARVLIIHAPADQAISQFHIALAADFYRSAGCQRSGEVPSVPYKRQPYRLRI